jgi:hypothetical protein
VNLPEGHLHMLLGNRVSVWNEPKLTIGVLKIGDNVFLYKNETGIIAFGKVISDCYATDYSPVKIYDKITSKSNSGFIINFLILPEDFCIVDWERKSFKDNSLDIDDKKSVLYSDIKKITNKVLLKIVTPLDDTEGKELESLYKNKF